MIVKLQPMQPKQQSHTCGQTPYFYHTNKKKQTQQTQQTHKTLTRQQIACAVAREHDGAAIRPLDRVHTLDVQNSELFFIFVIPYIFVHHS